MKQKSNKIDSQAGFTIVELLTVLAIMALIMGALAIDFAGQRGRRNIVLAENETVTNLRKVQSYMLSSKNISPGIPAKYYIATFQEGATNFTVQAIDKDFKYHDNIETVTLPSKTNISTLAIPYKDEKQQYLQPFGQDFSEEDGGGKPTIIVVDGEKVEAESFGCMQVIFSAPFGKMYTRGATKCYESIANILRDPVQISQLNERRTYIYFSEVSGTNTNSYLELEPITGQMTIH